MSRWFIYIVRCTNGSLYTGITTNVEDRIQRHNAGTGAKYTRAFGPVELVYRQAMRTATEARKLEAEIKQWSKDRKEAFLKSQQQISKIPRMPYPSPRPTSYQLRVKRGTSGLGLFTEEKIPRGKFIIEYWGDLLTDDEAQERGGRYLFELENGKTIDGRLRGNIARYINHACKPNSEVDVKGNRVFIKSIKAIQPGEEITYDYGKEYFDYYIKPHGCKCGSHRKSSKTKK